MLYSRTTISIFLCSALIAYTNVYFSFLHRGIGLFGGLFHTTCTTNVFHIFILVISMMILILTSFYPRKIWSESEDYDTKWGSLISNNLSTQSSESSEFSLKQSGSSSKSLESPSELSESSYFFYTPFSSHTFAKFKTKILNIMSEQYKITEYSLMLMFIITGALFLISTSDLVSVFLSIELQSYGLYLLSTIYRNSESATSGGLMYFLLGGLSSCFILLSTSLLYANSGTTNLDNLYIITSISDTNLDSLTFWYKPYYIHISLLIMSVGFLFKISAAPFHFWSPDVYDAIPTIVTTFVAIIAKISIFIFLLELVHYTSKYTFDIDFTWTTSLLLSSLLSLLIGTIVGLAQIRIKRLYAFSTISHIGFILLALSIHDVGSIQSFIFYIMQYSLSNLNAFILIITIGYSLFFYKYKDYNKDNKDSNKENKQSSKENKDSVKETKDFSKENENSSEESISFNKQNDIDELKDISNSPIQLIKQLKGYSYINPLLALSLSITLFSFVGIPPLIGFFAKQMVLSAALDNGYIFMSFIAILTSVISAVYYLAIIKQIYFDKPDYILKSEWKDFSLCYNLYEKLTGKYLRLENKNTDIINVNNITLSSSLSLIVSILTVIILWFIFIPEEWLSIANILSLILFGI